MKRLDLMTATLFGSVIFSLLGPLVPHLPGRFFVKGSRLGGRSHFQDKEFLHGGIQVQYSNESEINAIAASVGDQWLTGPVYVIISVPVKYIYNSGFHQTQNWTLMGANGDADSLEAVMRARYQCKSVTVLKTYDATGENLMRVLKSLTVAPGEWVLVILLTHGYTIRSHLGETLGLAMYESSESVPDSYLLIDSIFYALRGIPFTILPDVCFSGLAKTALENFCRKYPDQQALLIITSGISGRASDVESYTRHLTRVLAGQLDVYTQRPTPMLDLANLAKFQHAFAFPDQVANVYCHNCDMRLIRKPVPN